MRVTNPQVFVVAETKLTREGNFKFLEALGAANWDTDAHSGAEKLAEEAGRLCYKAFGTDLNKNLTKVREGNMQYIRNIIDQKHGSVLEHTSTSVVLLGVSRILTHELVRHRQGTAYSQESGRFVQLDDIPIYIPVVVDAFQEVVQKMTQAQKEEYFGGTVGLSDRDLAINLQQQYNGAMANVTAQAESMIGIFNKLINSTKVGFDVKKKLTSALRRMAPAGATNNIMVTANHRAWRFMIQQRTALGAEEEIRIVFGMIAREFQTRYPAFYQDMYMSGDGYEFSNSKI